MVQIRVGQRVVVRADATMQRGRMWIKTVFVAGSAADATRVMSPVHVGDCDITNDLDIAD